MPFPAFCRRLRLGAAPSVVVAVAAAGSACTDPSGRETRPLTVVAFSAVREALSGEILPPFAARWSARAGDRREAVGSYGPSGAQSRAVAAGLGADVVALSMDDDVERLVREGLVRPGWRDADSTFARSMVALAVRPGNPKGIRGWADLGRSDVSVLTPSPATSGGAMWNVYAVWGAALRGCAGIGAGGEDAARDLLRRVVARIEIMDRSARDSIQTFERGAGDVAITYDGEIAVARRAGRSVEAVVPACTLRMDHPVAVVDAYADAHGRRDAAEDFVAFLRGPEAQRALAAWGLRPVQPDVAREVAGRAPEPADPFTIDDLGGFARVRAAVFGPDGAWTRAVREGAPR